MQLKCTVHPDQQETSNNKNAFQWDAYRPLIDRMLASASWGGGSLVPGGGGVWVSGPGRGSLVLGGGSLVRGGGDWHPSMH